MAPAAEAVPSGFGTKGGFAKMTSSSPTVWNQASTRKGEWATVVQFLPTRTSALLLPQRFTSHPFLKTCYKKLSNNIFCHLPQVPVQNKCQLYSSISARLHQMFCLAALDTCPSRYFLPQNCNVDAVHSQRH